MSRRATAERVARALPLLLALATPGCTETVTGMEAVPRYRLEAVASGFDLPVTVQADAGGLLVAEQGGRIVRTDHRVVHDLSSLVPTDLNFVGGLLNLLVANGRTFAFLTTRDDRVLVAELLGARLDTLILADGFRVEHHGGGLALYRGQLLAAFGDGDTGTGRGPGLPGRLVSVDLGTRQRRELARGLRNPWRMALHGDSLWIVDAGDRAWEEVAVLDLNTSAVDFGWGVSEGPDCDAGKSCAGVTWPRYAYPTGPECSTVVGAAWYEGRFWFGDYCEGWIRSFGAGGALHHLDLGDRIVSIAQTAADAAPYVVTASGKIWRVAPEGR